MDIESIQLEFTGCGVLGAAFSGTPCLPEEEHKGSVLQQSKCCSGWPLACEDRSCCLFCQEQALELQAYLHKARGRFDTWS